ncbi:uncharacterized protein BO80DRAFT_357737 [Aspergillus ibericus CBS 121593]|uniref:Uncharacterized protein n=1 Tax=Aspergillus ibericus CBS 121593 TaxID=1448316 RepID=A0A395GXP9_9EURO|nr:hypothetical protein BO80DRAFT_357737 [Aspergillus ibericus CBS 121593]RAL00123.1 hypothetical protein BO80DRAFT_357737 [Aspergillus ibericus CBS 121593]
MSRGPGSDPGITEYQFVFGKDQPGTRSHAMRQFWRRRHQALQSSVRISRPQLRTLLPKECGSESGESQADVAQGKSPDSLDDGWKIVSGHVTPQRPGSNGAQAPNISIFPAPPTKFPIDLSPKDQTIFYSWLELHTSLTPDGFLNTRFDPIRDVWLPMDLSNSASFCALMAHAAAHVAHRHGQTKSLESEKFRTLAVGIIAKWLADERRSTQDETLAAIARLLMFEKYWALDDQWRAHRNGLLSVFRARGGLKAFKSNWRLHMVLFLAFSMSEPSRLSPSAHAWEISEYFVPSAVHPAIQLRFTHNKPKSFQGLHMYPTLHDTILFLGNDSSIPPPQGDSSGAQDHRLICLLILVVILQETFYSLVPVLRHAFIDKLPALDEILRLHRASWEGSPQRLHDFLMGDHLKSLINPPTRAFITKLSENLVYLNDEACGPIGKCLLNALLWQRPHERTDAISVYQSLKVDLS